MKKCFEGKKFSTIKVRKLASIYATDIQLSLEKFETFSIDPVNSRWNFPPPGYNKLNVDGGFRDRQGSFGGVLRDEKGNWIWGFRGRSCAEDPLHAEIIAMKMRIQALVINGCGRTIIETDSSTTVNFMQGFVDDEHPRAELIKECKDMLANVPYVAVSFTPRICHSCAHALAQIGYNSTQNDMYWVDVIPPIIRDVLLEDMYI